MKKILCAILLLLAINVSTFAQDSTEVSPTGNSQFYLLYFYAPEEKVDTLFVNCGSYECNLLYHGDTISTEWNYSSCTDFISNLGAFGCSNTFLIGTHAGDACPVIYKILEFKDDGTYFLSDGFGNCETFTSMKIYWPKLEFKFSAFRMAKRKKTKFIYSLKVAEPILEEK